jgi:hypothetical protein
MKFDFSNVDDVQSYVSVPPGKHLCRVTEVRPGAARDGSARWTFRLEVVGGLHHGRTAAWDSLTWSDRGVARVRHVLKGLGVQTHGVVEIEPQDLVGRRAHVQVQLEERENPQTGRREMRTRVPYAGYEPIGEGQSMDEAMHASSASFDAAPGRDCASSDVSDARLANDVSRFQPGRTARDDGEGLADDSDEGEHGSPFGPSRGRVYENACLSGLAQRAQLVSEATHDATHDAKLASEWDSPLRGFGVDRDGAFAGDDLGWSHHPAVCAPAAGDPSDGHGSKAGDARGDASTGSPTAASADGLATPTKRRPGRPRKHPLPPGQPAESTKPHSDGQAPKRRGRKPKNQGSA